MLLIGWIELCVRCVHYRIFRMSKGFHEKFRNLAKACRALLKTHSRYNARDWNSFVFYERFDTVTKEFQYERHTVNLLSTV